jgi:hypothetical protein
VSLLKIAWLISSNFRRSIGNAVPGIVRSWTIRGVLMILITDGPSDGMVPAQARLVSEGRKMMLARATTMTKLALTLVGTILGLAVTPVASPQATSNRPTRVAG